ncbi:MAG: glycosyltransferase family 87 protein, partial [Haloarculaceae archaeon]
MPSTRGPRLVLAVGVVAGLVNAVAFPLTQPEQVALASDVYYYAARAALSGGDFYLTPAAQPGFRYPPVVVLAFLPHALLGDPALAYALQVALDLAAAAGVAAISVRAIERTGVSLARLDRLLVAAYCLASVTVVTNLVMGQVNHLLALAIAGGALLLERDRGAESGVAFGLAALVKLFPALVGVWLLRRRAWRAIAAATVTGTTLSLAGVAAFGPAVSETFVTHVLTGELAVASFPHGPDPTAPYVTIRRQLTALVPGLPSDLLLVVGAFVLAPVFVGVNRVHATLRDRLVALLGTLLATLVLFPLEPFYLTLALFPLVPLLYCVEAGPPRRLLVVGAFV